MNIITPTADGFDEIGATSGLLKMVDRIGTILNTEINKDSVLVQIFGLAYPKYDQDGNAFPVVPSETLTSEIVLLPTDLWPGFCFFDYSDPTEVEQGGIRSNPRMKVQLAIVFFVDFKRFKGMTKWVGDYRLYREAFKSVVTSLLSNKMTALGGTLTLDKIIDKGIDDVFSGYKLSPDRIQFYQQPYYAVRFECELNFMQKVC